MLLIFFFKQKTAFEMRISDCSSDVCSSDLSIKGISCVTLRFENNRFVQSFRYPRCVKLVYGLSTTVDVDPASRSGYLNAWNTGGMLITCSKISSACTPTRLRSVMFPWIPRSILVVDVGFIVRLEVKL